jgi:transcriptional regulator of acetoin/glycerol metabolism
MADEMTTVTTGANDDPSSRGGQEPLGIWWLFPSLQWNAFSGGAVNGCSKIGRTRESPIMLEGSSVSRNHAELRREGPLWVLVDLKSKNGTFVNARRVERAALGPQDVVRIGEWVGVVCHCSEPPPDRLICELAPGWVSGERTRQRFELLDRWARSSLAIVLRGETGTGKEVAARALHALSGRSGDFIAVNCAAIPESLAEAQLFGHRKGAFTGAQTDSEGFLGAAHKGTLFLDEIADLPLGVQAKLLRALEDGAIQPLGSARPRALEFRVVCATQEPLAELVEKRLFRADLCARLSGLEIELTPLRKRREEILAILEHALSNAGAGSVRFTSRFVERLLCHVYPYNVREVVQLARLLANSGKELLNLEDLPEALQLDTPTSLTPSSGGKAQVASDGSRKRAWLMRYAAEFDRLRGALEANGGNLSQAARAIGMPRYRAIRLLAAHAELGHEPIKAQV